MPGPAPGERGKDVRLQAERAYADRKWKKALELYREAARECKGDPRVLQRVGDLCRRLKRREEAVAHYKKVAAIYAKAGFWAKAIAVNRIVLEIDPADVAVQRELAAMYGAQSTRARTVPAGMTLAGAPPRQEEAAPAPAGKEPRVPDSPAKAPGVDLVIGGTVLLEEAGSPGGDALGGKEAPCGEEAWSATREKNGLGAPVSKLSGVPFLSDLGPEEFYAVLESLAVRRYPAETYVCEEGDLGRSMYIVAEGQLEVFTREENGGRLLLGRLRGGDFFGEFGLLTNGERNATVQAKSDVELLEITASDLDRIAARHGRLWEVLEEHLRRRMTDTILSKSAVFRALTEEERRALIERLVPEKVKMDAVVLREGTPGEEMYFVKSGRLLVSTEEGPSRVIVGEIGAGEYFGEVAMLTGKPRTATVRARTDAELYRLARADAAPVLRGNREVLRRLREKMAERSRENVETYRSFREARATLELV